MTIENRSVVMIVPISLLNDLEDFREIVLDDRILVKFIPDDEFELLIQ